MHSEFQGMLRANECLTVIVRGKHCTIMENIEIQHLIRESAPYSRAGLANIMAAANLRAGLDLATHDMIGPRVLYEGHRFFGK